MNIRIAGTNIHALVDRPANAADFVSGPHWQDRQLVKIATPFISFSTLF